MPLVHAYYLPTCSRDGSLPDTAILSSSLITKPIFCS
jgi:hypothetical protein